MPRAPRFLCTIGLVPALLAAQTAARTAPPIAIVGAVVIDPRSAFVSAAAAAPQTIVISNGIIQDVGPVATTAIPAGVRRVNGDGKFVIPGLWDARVRPATMNATTRALQLALGITTARDSARGLEHAFDPPLSRQPPDARDTVYLELARAGTWYTPMLGVSKIAAMSGDSLLAAIAIRDERRPYLSPALAAAWRIQADARRRDTSSAAAERYHSSLADVRRMRELGVLMLAGTDAGSLLIHPGFALHEELVMFVEDAGLTPSQALWSATFGPAMAAGMSRQLGTVEKGRIADLVLLDASPLENIRNTRRIAAVVHGGRLYSRTELDAMLAKVREVIPQERTK
jgi:hypothetical protein